MATAWMVRKDGKAIPVIQHIYASLTCVEESLYAAQWLYEHTLDKAIRPVIIAFIKTWAVQMLHCEEERRYETILEEIEKRPYIFLTKLFVAEHEEEIRQGTSAGLPQKSVEDYNRVITLALNEEFMRVRFGGKYTTRPGNKELYFRISSENYCWNDVISNFLQEMKLDYETMQVVIDEESAEANPRIWKSVSR